MTFPISKAANQFAVEFFHCFVSRHGSKHKNLLICPYLIFHSLSMLLVGARGKTAEQLKQVMRIPSELVCDRKSCAADRLNNSDANSKKDSNNSAERTHNTNANELSSTAKNHRQGVEMSMDRMRHMPRASSASSISTNASSSNSVSPKESINKSKSESNKRQSQKVSPSRANKSRVSSKLSPASNNDNKRPTQSQQISSNETASIRQKQRFICDPEDEARHSEMLMLTEQLIHGNHEFVHQASFIYLDNSVKRIENFKQILRDFYETKPKKIDFNNEALMIKTINEDVARTTENIYKEILPQVEAKKCVDSFMLLVNAVFFRGFWLSNFTEVEQRTFTKYPSKLLDSDTSLSVTSLTSKSNGRQQANELPPPITYNIKMMSKLDHLPILNDKDLDAKIVRLPFEASDLHMFIILPNNPKSDSTYLCKAISASKIDSISRQLATAEPQYVRIRMPVFCVDSGKISIQSTLVKMGASDLFDKSKSNMSGMCATTPVWLNKILHRCFIICDNRGAITSSSTEMARKKQAILDKAAHRQVVTEFYADHPFLYMIIDSVTKTILLIGQYTDPSETLEIIHENQLSPEEAHYIYTEGVYKT